MGAEDDAKQSARDELRFAVPRCSIHVDSVWDRHGRFVGHCAPDGVSGWLDAERDVAGGLTIVHRDTGLIVHHGKGRGLGVRETPEQSATFTLFLDPEGLALETEDREARGHRVFAEFIPTETAAEYRGVDPIRQFFSFDHLSPHLQDVSRRICEPALWLLDNLPDNPERQKALDALLVTKDAAVRAKLYRETGT